MNGHVWSDRLGYLCPPLTSDLCEPYDGTFSAILPSGLFGVYGVSKKVMHTLHFEAWLHGSCWCICIGYVSSLREPLADLLVQLFFFFQLHTPREELNVWILGQTKMPNAVIQKPIQWIGCSTLPHNPKPQTKLTTAFSHWCFIADIETRNYVLGSCWVWIRRLQRNH